MSDFSTYKCTKEVQAEAMTRGDFVQYKYPTSAVNLSLDQTEPGYLVLFNSGYETWVPASMFDDSFVEVVDLADLDDDDDCGGACKI